MKCPGQIDVNRKRESNIVSDSMSNEKILSCADLGMHYGDLPFEQGGYEAFDDMMQRFQRTFAETTTNSEGTEVFLVRHEFDDKDRNAHPAQHGE